MNNSITHIIIYIVIPSIVGLFISYLIYGWFSHRARRDKHFLEVEKQLKMQSVYLRKIAGELTLENQKEIEELNAGYEKRIKNT